MIAYHSQLNSSVRAKRIPAAELPYICFHHGRLLDKSRERLNVLRSGLVAASRLAGVIGVVMRHPGWRVVLILIKRAFRRCYK